VKDLQIIKAYPIFVEKKALQVNKQVNKSTRDEEDILHLSRLYAVLSLVNQAMVRARSPEELFADVCRIAVENGAFMLVWIGLHDPETHAVIPVAWAGEPQDFVRKVNVIADDRPRGQGPTGTAIREGLPVIINNVLTSRYAFPWREELDAAGIRAAASFPISIGDTVRGALTLYVSEIDFFKEKEIALLKGVAEDISFSLERMEEEKQRRQAEDALKESEWRYREVFDNASNGIFVLDVTPEGKFRYASLNPSGEKMLGYSIADISGKSPEEFLPPENAEILNANYSKCIKAGAQVDYEYDINLNAGYRYFHTTLVPVRDKSGRICRIIGIADNITERKRAEEELKKLNENLEYLIAKRTVQLEAANKELEAFCYSVSHDLRAPLRSIDGFSQALLEDYGDKLDAQGQDYLRRVRAASQHMAQLIDDLLKLSRVTRREICVKKVNLSKMALAIVAELKSAQPERRVDFVIAPEVYVNGDEGLLMVLLENLMDNAWKFTSKHQHARIEFGVIEDGGKEVYFVSDDGAGFDMAYAGKLFGAFQRLHAMNEFPGTGIGLATVQRIIHLHGGRVWAEGAVEKGATIYFTL